MSLEAVRIHHSGMLGTDPTLLDDKVEELDLLGDSAANRAQGYWKLLNTLIRQQLRSRRSLSVRRMTVVHFRLYMNGEAQLIEIERSSGDTDLDHAAILAVLTPTPSPLFLPEPVIPTWMCMSECLSCPGNAPITREKAFR